MTYSTYIELTEVMEERLEARIFRRFSELRLLSLLSLQTGLSELEGKLRLSKIGVELRNASGLEVDEPLSKLMEEILPKLLGYGMKTLQGVSVIDFF